MTMRNSRRWTTVLPTALATLAVWGLMVQLSVTPSETQGKEAEESNPRPLTTDGHSRFAAWSPDGHTVLVNRWGKVIEDGPTHQTLSELWSVDIRDNSADKLSDNAIRPSYSDGGEQLAYLTFISGEEDRDEEGERWEVHTLNLKNGTEITHGPADWHIAPTWTDDNLDYPEGARKSPLAFMDASVLHIAQSPDGRRVAYVTGGPSTALWTANTSGKPLPRLLARGNLEIFSAPTWSPDTATLAFSRAPLGAEAAYASDIWLVDADGANLRPALQNQLEESNPAWSPDGRYLAFDRAGDVWLLDLTQPLEIEIASQVDTPSQEIPATELPAHQSIDAQQTPPATIRVFHNPSNYYRDVPPGQIDEIPFEDYVKRCVPVEVYASWPAEALKTQATAARTYAWYYTIVHADEAWHVSDWTDYQVMGRDDQRHPRSDAAVDATRGQYIAYRGDVIKAFYSADNGSPTRSATGYDYIQAVNDPVSFGQERRGHGWGMSQWGAYRWAAWHGWGYQQILAHYYTDVTIELPSTGGPMPLGGVTLPWSNHFVTSNHIHIAANASDEASDLSTAGFYAVTDTAALIITDTFGDDGWSTVWDASALSDTSTSEAITLALRVVDGTGHRQIETQSVHIGLDRRPPTATLAVVDDPYPKTITITLSGLSASDPIPGSGVQAMAFSNAGWTWEGEDLYHTPGTGEIVDDIDALNGQAWRGLTGLHSPGAWYGPYTTDLPLERTYRAYFRLKTSDVTTTAEVALLDVVDDGGARLLGLRRLRGTDFRAADAYQEFPVDFDYADAGSLGLEFRVAFRATADLYLDRVLVVGYPVDFSPTAQWRLTPGEGHKVVTVKFIDGASNVSADLTRTLTLDVGPPTGWHDFAPEQWDGGPSPICTVRVHDTTSGLDAGSARYRFTTDGGVTWGDWLTATCSGDSGTTATQTIATAPIPFGLPRATANRVQFLIADVAGLTSTATYIVRGPVSIVGPTTCPLKTSCTFTARITLLTGTLAPPITYTWQATDWPLIERIHYNTTNLSWTIAGPKFVSVTVAGRSGNVGAAIHHVFAGWLTYLPTVLRD